VQGSSETEVNYLPKITSDRLSINLGKRITSSESGLAESMIKSQKEEEKQNQSRKMLLFSILISLFFIQTVNTNVTTMVPNYCQK
jgi:hypothetical protein